MLEKILKFLSGKKGSIATILMGIAGYLATKGILGEPEIVLITIIVSSLFGATSIATAKFVYKKQ